MNSHAIVWDGSPRPDVYSQEAREARKRLADSARDLKWDIVLQIIRKNPEWINASRPGGKSLYTPLHQAAYGGAPIGVVESLLYMGAWRAIRTKDGKRPVDIAREKNHQHLFEVLEPKYCQKIPLETLRALQRNFHELIQKTTQDLITENRVRLPELEPLTEYDPGQTCWFAIHGMFGGFNYWLEEQWGSTLLISESWCRVLAGSGKRYLITPFGIALVAEGFV